MREGSKGRSSMGESMYENARGKPITMLLLKKIKFLNAACSYM